MRQIFIYYSGIQLVLSFKRHISFSKSPSCASSRYACDILTRSTRAVWFYPAIMQ